MTNLHMVPAIPDPLSSQPCDTRRVLSNIDRMGHCPNQQWWAGEQTHTFMCFFLFRAIGYCCNYSALFGLVQNWDTLVHSYLYGGKHEKLWEGSPTFILS